MPLKPFHRTIYKPPRTFSLLIAGLLNSLLFAVAAQAGSVLDVQPFLSRQTLPTESGPTTFVNLNTRVGNRYLVEKAGVTVTIERPPMARLTEISAAGIRFADGYQCDLWGKSWDEIVLQSKQRESYLPLCDGRLLLLGSPAQQNISTVEWSANFLRDHLGSVGDSVVDYYKNATRNFNYQQANYRTLSTKSAPQSSGPRTADTLAPLAISFADSHLKVQLKDSKDIQLGGWYSTENYDAVYVSVTTLAATSPSADKSKSAMQSSMIYSAAVELDSHRVGWMHGTQYPGVGWSKRYLSSGYQPAIDQPGPNGYSDLAPLALPAALPPYWINQTIATFAGGFKREHGAFRQGEFSKANSGSHYGFIENGVTLSPLITGLATFFSDTKGNVSMKTWQDEDNALLLPTIVYARQNGVPLIESYNEDKDESVIGSLVNDWGRGNWSGQAANALNSNAQLIAPRSSICIAKNNDKRYLIYSYFTNHSPEAMAEVLKAYHCEYAIHLDMNSPQHAMFSLFRYHPELRRFETECLYDKMQCLPLPRFITADNRDFFWIMER